MARSTRKFVTLREAIELMRNGQSLAQMHVSGGGKAWFIAPRGGEVGPAGRAPQPVWAYPAENAPQGHQPSRLTSLEA